MRRYFIVSKFFSSKTTAYKKLFEKKQKKTGRGI